MGKRDRGYGLFLLVISVLLTIMSALGLWWCIQIGVIIAAVIYGLAIVVGLFNIGMVTHTLVKYW